jgi:hypothetical protein
MKKMTVLFLSALLALTPLASLAEEQYCSISDLRAQAPAEWTETFETKWRTVDIDAEIVLPDVDAVPVITVGYDQRTPLLTAGESGWDSVEVSERGLILSKDNTKTVPKKMDGKRINSSPEVKGDWYSGFAPENTYVPLCDVTFGEICDEIGETLTLFGYDPDDFMVDRPSHLWAQHWYYYGKKKDALPGQVLMDFYQKIGGIPLLCHIWTSVHNHSGLTRFDEYFDLLDSALYAGYDSYQGGLDCIFIDAMKLKDTLADDVPLCSLDTVEAAVAEEINAGHIRKVYELQFGYVLYNEPGEYRDGDDSDPYPYDTLYYYAKPAWLVNCLYVSAAKGKLCTYTEAENDGDERNSLDYYQFVVDAQTGELALESDAKDRCEYKGFVSWDDVKKE